MKRIVTLLIAVLLTISMVSCAQEPTELTSKNILDYINVQLVFGNIEQCFMENSYSGIILGDSNKETTYTSFISCMCYIYVSPKGNYNFENASVEIGLENDSFSDGWLISEAEDSGIRSVVRLDKNGYGIASVHLRSKSEIDHPAGDIEYSVIHAFGLVSKEK